MATIEEAFDVVSKTFRISALNAPQKNGITKIVEEGKDVFINLPTGLGKSLLSSVIKPHEGTVLTIRKVCHRPIMLSFFSFWLNW